MTSFLLKNKIATPVRRRFSAAFTAVAAGAVPSVAGKDMQHEERTLPAAPPSPRQPGRVRGREVLRLSLRWRVFRLEPVLPLPL